MADSNQDILMWIKGKNGGYLMGETQLAIDKTDTEFFSDIKTFPYSEIMDFDFGVSLVDKDTTKKKKKKEGDKSNKSNDDEDESGQGKFYKFITSDSDAASSLYPVTFEEVKVSRQLDSISTGLMTNCVNRTSLQKVTIVRRRAMGVDGAHTAFLRLDFENVLITDLSWEADEKSMKETFKFICRKLTMKYRPQNTDGSLGTSKNSGPNSLMETT